MGRTKTIHTSEPTIARVPRRRSARRIRGPAILEAHVQRTVVELLELDGWRAFRTELTVQKERGRVVGERGQPDYLFIRYLSGDYVGVGFGVGYHTLELKAPVAEVLWIEFKRPGEKPRGDQQLWHAAERERGALVMVVDDIDAFLGWYAGSGLQRRIAERKAV